MSSLLENNPYLNMFRGCDGKPEGHVQFLGLGKGKDKAASDNNLLEVYAEFPYPPINCADAEQKIAEIQNRIKGTQEAIAAGATDRVGKRYIESYQKVMGQLKEWQIENKCEQQAIKADDDAFYNQLMGTIDNETSKSKSTGTIDNLVVFGVLGVLGIGALIIILRR